MEIFEPFLDLNNLKFVGKSNGMHEFSSKQLFIIVSYFVYEMYHCAAPKSTSSSEGRVVSA